jgi:hypothetical protein
VITIKTRCGPAIQLIDGFFAGGADENTAI